MAGIWSRSSVNSQGKNLKEARFIIKDALKLMAECYVDAGKALPKPNPRARDKNATTQEEIVLEFQVRALAKT